ERPRAREGLDGGVGGTARQERHLAEDVAGAEARAFALVAEDARLAAEEEKEAGHARAGFDDAHARLELEEEEARRQGGGLVGGQGREERRGAEQAVEQLIAEEADERAQDRRRAADDLVDDRARQLDELRRHACGDGGRAREIGEDAELAEEG